MWINLIDVKKESWEKYPWFHNVNEWKSIKLSSLPAPFSKPDLIVFEEIYFLKMVMLAREAKKKGVPYIIVPRGCMTKQAFNNKSKWKKVIAHPFIFDAFIKNALAIQYLSEQERNNSRKIINPHSFVIPNGINIPKGISKQYSNDGIRGVFIGRIDIYQKGLDVFLQAITETQDLLRKHNFSLRIYGPENSDAKRLREMVANYSINDFVEVCGSVVGDRKKQVLLDSDVFFLTSRSEGVPMGLLEALSYGVPALVTTGTGQRDNIEKYAAGWGCDFDVKDISRGLREMVSDANKLEEMGNAAVSLAKVFDWNQLAQQFHNEIMNRI